MSFEDFLHKTNKFLEGMKDGGVLGGINRLNGIESNFDDERWNDPNIRNANPALYEMHKHSKEIQRELSEMRRQEKQKKSQCNKYGELLKGKIVETYTSSNGTQYNICISVFHWDGGDKFSPITNKAFCDSFFGEIFERYYYKAVDREIFPCSLSPTWDSVEKVKNAIEKQEIKEREKHLNEEKRLKEECLNEAKYAWENIIYNYQIGSIIDGVVVNKVRGGWIVNCGVDAFLPASQVDPEVACNLEKFIGQRLDFKIININVVTKSIVLSRRALQKENYVNANQNVGSDNSRIEIQDIKSNISQIKEFIIDGSNIMRMDEQRYRITLCKVLAITNTLDVLGIHYKVIFDASAKHVLHDIADEKEHKYLVHLFNTKPNQWFEAPAKTQVDDYILTLAGETPEIHIISNDKFDDEKGKQLYAWASTLDSQKRFHRGMVNDGKIYFPGLYVFAIPDTIPEIIES